MISWHVDDYGSTSFIVDLFESLSRDKTYTVYFHLDDDNVITIDSDYEVIIGATALGIASEGSFKLVNTDKIIYIDAYQEGLNMRLNKNNDDKQSSLNDSKED